EAVTGRRPFRGDTTTDTITRIIRDEAPIPAGVSQGLATIIARCMRKDREERYASAREVAQALEQQLAVAPTAPLTRPPERAAAPTVITGTRIQPAPAGSRAWVWIAAVALLLLAACVMSQLNKQPPPQTVAAPATTVTEPPPNTATTEVNVTAPTTSSPPPP